MKLRYYPDGVLRVRLTQRTTHGGEVGMQREFSRVELERTNASPRDVTAHTIRQMRKAIRALIASGLAQ